jgi:multiple RNA-binding domain-containing protein 1
MDVMQGSDANAIPIEANKPARDDKIHTKKVEEVISEEIEPDNEEIDDAEWLRRRKATTDASNGDAGSSTQPSTKTSLSPEESLILQTSRLFIRNLSFLTTTSDLTTFLSPYGEVSEIHLPLSKTTKEPLGTAFVQFKNAEDAVTAWKGVDGRTWMGRLIHVLPGRSKGGEGGVVGVIEGGDVVDGKNVVGKVLGKEEKNVKAEVMKKRKEEGGKGLNWATLYMNVSRLFIIRSVHSVQGSFADGI